MEKNSDIIKIAEDEGKFPAEAQMLKLVDNWLGKPQDVALLIDLLANGSFDEEFQKKVTKWPKEWYGLAEGRDEIVN